MPPKKAPAPHTQLVMRLREWALRNKVQDHPFLTGISEALENQSDLQFWSNYSMLAEFPNSLASEDFANNKYLNYFHQFRNVMVFAPIAFTWASISTVATNYAHFTKAHANINLNFLDFWENGYSVMNPIWKLSNVAIIDFFIILSIMISSIVIVIIENKNENNRLQYSEANDYERIKLALEIDRVLQKYRNPTSLSIKSDLKRASADLQKITSNLQQSSKEIKTYSKSVQSYENLIKRIELIQRQLKK